MKRMNIRILRTVSSCVYCEKTISIFDDFNLVNNEIVCPFCYEWQTFRCTCCMEYFFNDEACYDEENFPYCEKCFEALRADEYEYDEEEDDDEELAPVDIAG